MAKNKGFASLAALQNKVAQTETVEEVKEPTNVTNEDGTVVVEVPEETTQPTWDTIDQVPALFESAEDEQADQDAESVSLRGLTPNVVQMDEATFARGQNPVVTPVDELGVIPTESFTSVSTEANIATKLNEAIAPAQPIFDAPVEEPVKPAYILRTIDQWTDAELEAYIAGTCEEETYVAQLKQAVSEHRKRYSTLAKAWSVEECREFLLNGTVPAKTTKGAWVKDVTRQYRREHEWETNELESWALGEIAAGGVTTDGGLAIELKSRLNLNVPSVDVNAVITNYRHATNQVTAARQEQRPEPNTPTVTEAKIAEVTKTIQLEGLTLVNQSYIESSLAQFESVMKVGRAVSETQGGDAQKLLRDVIVYAIQLPDPVGSRNAMQYLLEYFRARRGIGQLFEDTYAYRNIPDMRAPKKDQVAHHDLLTLFLVYADPMVELREQTDIPSLIGNVNPQFQSRVLEFFARQK